MFWYRDAASPNRFLSPRSIASKSIFIALKFSIFMAAADALKAPPPLFTVIFLSLWSRSSMKIQFS